MSPGGELLATLRGESKTPTWATNTSRPTRRKAPSGWSPTFLLQLIYPGGFGTTADREESANVEKLLWGPTAVKLDGKGNILIVDSCRHRIQVYQRAD